MVDNMHDKCRRSDRCAVPTEISEYKKKRILLIKRIFFLRNLRRKEVIGKDRVKIKKAGSHLPFIYLFNRLFHQIKSI